MEVLLPGGLATGKRWDLGSGQCVEAPQDIRFLRGVVGIHIFIQQVHAAALFPVGMTDNKQQGPTSCVIW